MMWILSTFDVVEFDVATPFDKITTLQKQIKFVNMLYKTNFTFSPIKIKSVQNFCKLRNRRTAEILLVQI
jgi:hypothetical protein